MLRKPSLQVALSLYMSIGLLAACAPGPNDMAGSESLAVSDEASLEARAQSALASFHEVDGSFSDTLQLASLARPQTPTAQPEAEAKLLSFEPSPKLEQMRKLATAMRATLIQKGHVSIAPDGSFEVNDDKLQSELQAQLQMNPELKALEDLEPGAVLKPVMQERLSRLGQNGLEALAAHLAPISLDGRVINRFAASYRAEGLEREVLVSRAADAGFQAVLDERGDGFTRHAIRSAEPQADGSLRMLTNLTVHLFSGERLDLFEERYVTTSGDGVGHGNLRLLGLNGKGVRTGELRTLVNADGSLTTHLDLDDGEDLMLYEDASGRSGLALLSARQPSGKGIALNTLMQAGLAQSVDIRAFTRSDSEPPPA